MTVVALIGAMVRTGGPIRYDVAALAFLTGVGIAGIEAHCRLGHFIVADGWIVSVK